jgi:hypothetical protein
MITAKAGGQTGITAAAVLAIATIVGIPVCTGTAAFNPCGCAPSVTIVGSY